VKLFGFCATIRQFLRRGEPGQRFLRKLFWHGLPKIRVIVVIIFSIKAIPRLAGAWYLMLSKPAYRTDNGQFGLLGGCTGGLEYVNRPLRSSASATRSRQVVCQYLRTSVLGHPIPPHNLKFEISNFPSPFYPTAKMTLFRGTGEQVTAGEVIRLLCNNPSISLSCAKIS
jgi:hypothetical protein